MIYLPTSIVSSVGQYAKKPSYMKRVRISYLVSRVVHVLFFSLNSGLVFGVCVILPGNCAREPFASTGMSVRSSGLPTGQLSEHSFLSPLSSQPRSILRVFGSVLSLKSICLK